MLTYSEALDRVLLTIQPLPCEELPLPEALGRTLAETVTAAWDMPPADNSAMDGYALALGGGEPQSEWKVIGLARAGVGHCGEVPAAAAVKIMTGAPLPAGCDTVAPLETVEQLPDGRIRLRERLRQGDHVRCRGEEFRQGEPLLVAGTALKAGAIGLLAAAGVARVRVHRRPRVALLTTGDELVDLGVRPGPGQIVNSNRYLLTARLQEEGAEVWPLEIAGDSRQELSDRLAQGLQSDLLLTTGGVSMGEYDLVKECLGELGFQLGFWKVAIKPGKPVLFGTARGTPVFGLPGNPAAAAATFELFARPALRRLAGDPAPHPRRCRASLACGVRGAGNRQSFLWGRVEESQGHYLFTPSSRQSSGQMRGLQGAQALLPLAADGPDLAAGSEVELLLIYLP
jgi:molybdopterin molybdotransferase